MRPVALASEFMDFVDSADLVQDAVQDALSVRVGGKVEGVVMAAEVPIAESTVAVADPLCQLQLGFLARTGRMAGVRRVVPVTEHLIGINLTE
jgi:hypothetical protein